MEIMDKSVNVRKRLCSVKKCYEKVVIFILNHKDKRIYFCRKHYLIKNILNRQRADNHAKKSVSSVTS